jgi:uncharacterized protein
MPRQKILIVGVSVRSIVESAVHCNYPVIALDGFGDRDLRAMTETHALSQDFHVPYSASALFDASRRLDFDAVAYTSNLENHPEVLDRFAANHRIIGNSPQTVRAVRHWPDLFSRLERAGFSIPETVFDPTEKVNVCRRWLVKPVSSGGGHGVGFWREGTFAEKRFMLQQYIPGKACSASFIANGSDAVLVGISEQWAGIEALGVRRFRYCGNVLPLPEILESETGKTTLEQIRRMATFLTREFGLTGANGFDFILHENQVVLIEVNPRYSASMELVERAYDLPVFHLHTEAVLHGRLPRFTLESQLNGSRFFGKAVLFCEKDCVAPEVLDDPAAGLRDMPMPGETMHAGSPFCTLLTCRPTYDEILIDLIRRAAKLKKQIYG